MGVFEAALPIYEEAVRKNGFNDKLSYTENNSNNSQKMEDAISSGLILLTQLM